MSQRMRRILLQVGIFISMVFVAMLDNRLYTTLLAASILLALPVVWLAAGLLLWSSRQAPDIQSLSDAADNLLTVAISTSVAAVLAVVVLARVLGFISESVALITTTGLGYIVVASTLPSFRALQTWREVWVPMIRLRRP